MEPWKWQKQLTKQAENCQVEAARKAQNTQRDEGFGYWIIQNVVSLTFLLKFLSWNVFCMYVFNLWRYV